MDAAAPLDRTLFVVDAAAWGKFVARLKAPAPNPAVRALLAKSAPWDAPDPPHAPAGPRGAD